MRLTERSCAIIVAVFLIMPLVGARRAVPLQAQAGKGAGSLTIDSTTTTFAHAVRTTKQNPFNEEAADTVVVLSDRPLSVTEAGDDAALFARAQRNEIVTLSARFDGRRGRGQLFNVAINAGGLSQTVLLPDVWFQYVFKNGVGMLKMDRREFDGRFYSAVVDFTVLMPVETTEASPASTAAAGLPPPSKTDADRRKATALLIQTLQEGDEARALAVVALGIDPNGRDEKMGIPAINWAVLMCQPLIVKALVELKADLTHERMKGMTLLSEAMAACPDAVAFLKGRE